MAYMNKDGKGPYPNKAGDYCGNHFSGGQVPHVFSADRTEEAKAHSAWLAKMRFGRPRPTTAMTIEELQREGMVGLYLKADEPLYLDGDTEIPTPAELMEPDED